MVRQVELMAPDTHIALMRKQLTSGVPCSNSDQLHLCRFSFQNCNVPPTKGYTVLHIF